MSMDDLCSSLRSLSLHVRSRWGLLFSTTGLTALVLPLAHPLHAGYTKRRMLTRHTLSHSRRGPTRGRPLLHSLHPSVPHDPGCLLEAPGPQGTPFRHFYEGWQASIAYTSGCPSRGSTINGSETWAWTILATSQPLSALGDCPGALQIKDLAVAEVDRLVVGAPVHLTQSRPST